MNESTFAEVPAGLGPVLAKQGFKELTPVQLAVLDPDNSGRDLRRLPVAISVTLAAGGTDHAR